LLKKEGKWQESRAIYQECVDYFKKDNDKYSIAIFASQHAQIYQDRGE
jgi:hypothetical protein